MSARRPADRGRRSGVRRTTIVLASPASPASPMPAGALYWPEERLLVVADLHLEKGSSFARAASLLPPYDTAGNAGAARAR